MRVGPLVSGLTEALAPLGAVRDDQLSGAILVLPRAELIEAATAARTRGFGLLLDVFAIDWLHYPGHRGPRFSVTYHVHAVEANERCSLRVHLDDHDTLPTVTGIWPAANFLEREVYDLFGVTFDDHPDLRKLVTPEDLEGHPLRKDFPIGETPTLFNDGRFLDPATFRAGMIGASQGRTGWVGGTRKGVVSEIDDAATGEKGGRA
ncbi:MAG: NADH-quinone oxidoreductase subunit C [bacterium]|nr:NADH-quinone oxidoreductase subunit C [bacterium]